MIAVQAKKLGMRVIANAPGAFPGAVSAKKLEALSKFSKLSTADFLCFQ